MPGDLWLDHKPWVDTPVVPEVVARTLASLEDRIRALESKVSALEDARKPVDTP